MPQSTPEVYHRRHHFAGWYEFETCARCIRAFRTCLGKRRFATPAEADVRVNAIRQRDSYELVIARYRCRWCEGWHLTSHPGRVGKTRHEKQRRRWLFAQELERRANAMYNVDSL